ncbi:MAG: chromosomal replication initiator protein DnaA [Sedimentisphaerales bacterium]|nr:chromosomal replication initiator protein DnaA [Sedimentisphaerales bacterium]
MTMTADDHVEKINAIIAHKVGPQRYKIWFKNSTKLAIEDNYLKVGVPNLFIGGWIENHFSDQIQAAVREVTHREMKVIFTIDPELFGSQRRRQLDSQAESVARNANPSPLQRRTNRFTRSSRLRLKLDNFVVGPSNQLAYNAAKTVINEPGKVFNPLFIHGGCGLGKTHLLQGICNCMAEAREDLNWTYVSGEDFTNQFVLALKMGKLDSFRRRFRNTELLVIDDVHFLASKKATQEEFLHTFNAIDTAGKQVIMASDAHPKMIGQLSESLVNRFISGMVVKVEIPDFATRCTILRQRALEMKKQIPDAVIEYIAEHLRANIRELEGALLKVIAYSSLSRTPVNLAMAHEALADHITRTDPIVHLSDIESAVATFFGITPADVHSSRKTRTVSLARSVAMYLARKHTSMSFPEIGRFMGNKNHATVILACRKVDELIKKSADKNAIWETPAGRREMKMEAILKELEHSISR